MNLSDIDRGRKASNNLINQSIGTLIQAKENGNQGTDSGSQRYYVLSYSYSVGRRKIQHLSNGNTQKKRRERQTDRQTEGDEDAGVPKNKKKGGGEEEQLGMPSRWLRRPNRAISRER